MIATGAGVDPEGEFLGLRPPQTFLHLYSIIAAAVALSSV